MFGMTLRRQDNLEFQGSLLYFEKGWINEIYINFNLLSKLEVRDTNFRWKKQQQHKIVINSHNGRLCNVDIHFI